MRTYLNPDGIGARAVLASLVRHMTKPMGSLVFNVLFEMMRPDPRPVGFSVKGRLRRWLLWATVWLALGVGNPAQGSEAQKTVLLLYSQRSDLEANITVDRTIRSTLETVFHDLDYYSEYIDTTRFPEPDYQLALRDFLRRKYARQKFDLIITVASTALRFVRAFGSELFPGTPVVTWGGRDVIESWGAGPRSPACLKRWISRVPSKSSFGYSRTSGR